MNQIEATSYYAFAEAGRFYLFNTARVSVFQVPEPVYRIAGLWESHKPQDIFREMCHHYPGEQVKQYLANALKLNLFSSTPSQSQANTSNALNELYLQVCHDCNLKCRYCYADGGQFGGNAQRMDIQTALKAVDLFLDQLPPDITGFINYDGGEPLLNWPAILRTTEHAAARARVAGKRIAFKLGTNGTLLDRNKAEYMNRYGFSVGFSIDGDQQTHDACRRYNEGNNVGNNVGNNEGNDKGNDKGNDEGNNESKGSYKKIADNLAAFKETLRNCTLQARATITRVNLDVNTILKHLAGLGFSHVYFEPASGVPAALALGEADYDIIEEQCGELANDYIKTLLKGEIISITNFDMFLKRLHLKKKFHYKCEVGRTGIAVTPGGEIFPCYKFANVEGFKMADIGNGGLVREKQNRFAANHVDARQDCKHCWARYLCGGGCAYLGYLDQADISRKNHWECRFTRHMIKLAINIYVRVNQKEPDFWNRYFKTQDNKE